ncbi:MAG: hypothetical protein ACQESP_01215 [Candidatus Muiribacteriota bacterium]
MAKWQDIKLESPRERIKKRKKREEQKKQELKAQKNKVLKIKIAMVFVIFIFFISGAVFIFIQSKQKEQQQQIEETKKVNVLPTTGNIDIRRVDEVDFKPPLNEELYPGDSIRLEKGSRARLDFGNEILVSIRGPIQLTVKNIEVPRAGIANLDIEFEDGVLVGRKPTGRGEIKIQAPLGKVEIKTNSLSVFKVEMSEYNQRMRVAVRDGEVEVAPQNYRTKIVVPARKQLVIDNTPGYLDVGNVQDLNALAEGWD